LNFKIKKIYKFLPNKIETLDELCQSNKDWAKKKIIDKTGINKKRIVKKNQTIKDLLLGLKNNNNISELHECGLIILVTQTPHFTIPSNANYLQNIFKLKQSCIAFDINQGCSGYIYGLAASISLMKQFGIKKAALITCDTYSKFINKKNRACRTIFGDAATLSILEASKSEHFLGFKLGSDGSGFNNFLLKNGEISMNGPEMFNFAKNSVPNEINSIIKKVKLDKKQVKYFIFHQASKLIIDTIGKNLQIPERKLFKNLYNLGNTVSSSIPLALYDLFKKGKVKKKDLIVLSGFGVGYSWGSCVYKH
jgi:3-oxoacyl-[acyl-carrier-protein] synthase III